MFGLINELPTIYEVVNGKNKVKTSGTNHSSKKSKSNSKVVKFSVLLMVCSNFAIGLACLSLSPYMEKTKFSKTDLIGYTVLGDNFFVP